MCGLSKFRIAQLLITFVVIVGFGISCVYIHAKGTAFPDKGDCALPFEVANLTEASLEKSIISQWRWTYEDESEGLKIRAKCPSLHQDADVFHNGKLIARTQGQIFNFEGSFDLLDCNGKKFGRWSAGSWENAITNFYTFSVNSFLEKDGEIVGWIEGENFMSDNIVIRAADSENVVASMSRDIISLTWTWEIHRHHPMHPAADWRFILGIIGKESFAEDSDEHCICNQYFYHLGYTLIGVICLIFCCGLYVCCQHGPAFMCDACLSTMECCENVSCELCCNKDTSTDNGSQNHRDCSIDMTNIGTTNVDTTPHPEIPLN